MSKQLTSILEKTVDTALLTGGSICKTQRLQTQDNQYYVYKQLPSAPSNFFIAEKVGLETLAKSNVVKTPRVYAVSADGILLQYIKPIRPNNKHWQMLGEKLACLHRIKNQRYGFTQNNFIGLIQQDNHWQDDWLTFYREQRLLPLSKHMLFNRDDQQRWGKLFTLLDTLLDNAEPPALLHGDLWNTNIIFTNTDIYLIDPAVYYGSREIEIAYLEFVGDFHRPLIEAYQANYPLAADYAERKNLYLLYPYLVHLHLFGRAYLPGIREILYYYT